MRSHRERPPVIGVLGGCGGVGASSLAAVLAARGTDDEAWPVLIDLDPFGGGLDWALGAETVEGPRWSDLHTDGGRLDPEQLAEGLPRWDDVPFLACDSIQAPSAEAVHAVLTAATSIGPVIVDLGRFPSEARETGLRAADAVVLVVPGEVRAVTAAAGLRHSVDDTVLGSWHLVVRSDRAALDPDDVAELLALPLAGCLGADPGLRSGRDRGIDLRRVRGSTVRLTRTLMEQASG